MVSKAEQVKFFEWQLHELGLLWETYLKSSMNVLFAKKKCFLGKLHGLDLIRGSIIVKFNINEGPRLETPYCLYLINDLKNLQGNFLNFAKDAFGTGDHNVMPLYYLDRDENNVFIGIGNVPIQILDLFVEKKSAERSIPIILGEPEPPYAYFQNLLAFTKNNGDKINPIGKGEYHHKIFTNDKAQTIIDSLENQDILFIQGPPGTGKSTLTAEIINKYGADKKVCVAALANKALIEIAQKDGLKKSKFNIYKTNLTASEKREISYLQPIDDHNMPSHFILLTTYFKLSHKLTEINKPLCYYDLLVIEEASQAFYTTIFAFSYLAKKVIVIGDPKQLQPIILNETKAENISIYMKNLINGMGTMMSESSSENYLLNESFRLNEYNTKLTNCFYEGKLISKSKDDLQLNLSNASVKYFEASCPTKLILKSSLSTIADLQVFSKTLKEILEDINRNNKGLVISILTPFRKDVIFLQEELFTVVYGAANNIIIETIDRVQGLTVDINILILRLENAVNFIFNSNRFNVATSRSRHYNLIVTDIKFSVFNSTLPKEVSKYLGYLTIL